VTDRSVVFLDTASPVSAVALVCEGEVVGLELLEPRAPAEQAGLAVERLLAAAATAVADLSAVGVSVGPGSYTGVRVGMALGCGLALVDDLPLIAVGTLEVLAGLAPGDVRQLTSLARAQRGCAYRQDFYRDVDGGELVAGDAELVELPTAGAFRAQCLCIEGRDIATAFGLSADAVAAWRLPSERILWIDSRTRAVAGACLAWRRWLEGGGARGACLRPSYVGGSGAVAGAAGDPLRGR
jgi:tRNA threonylcarbamoyladenosine biosynthesis protein TsaB